MPPSANVLCAVAGLDALGPDLDAAAFASRLAGEGGVLGCRPDVERRLLFLHKADRHSVRMDAAGVVKALGDLRAAGEPEPRILVTSVRDFLKKL